MGEAVSVFCSVCKHWRAIWKDDTDGFPPKGNCTLNSFESITTRTSTCVKGELISLSTVQKLNDSVRTIKSEVKRDPMMSLEEEMEHWYKQHEAEFADVGYLRDTPPEGEERQTYKTGVTKRSLVVEGIDILGPSTRGDLIFEHQADDIMRFKDESEQGQFSEQGCGKSAIELRIAAYKYLKGEIDSVLVIAPNDVHKQWAMQQIPLWLPSEIRREVQCFGGRGGRKETYPFVDPNALHILCVNIDTFSTPNKWREITEWAKAVRCFIILDEGTSIKNPSSKRSERILYEFNEVQRHRTRILSSKVKTVARAILTGTPITNGLTDMWSIMEFLRPNYFNRNYYSFKNHYTMLATIATAYGSTQIPLTRNIWEGVKGCKDYDTAYATFGVSFETYNIVQMQEHYQGAIKNEKELRDTIAPISVFRAIKDCIDMPEDVYLKQVVSMSVEQQKAYRSMESELLAMYKGATTTAANKMSALTRLSQISSGFIVQGALQAYDPEAFELTGDDYDLEPGEVQWLGSSVPKLDALYRDVAESSKPLIIITRFSAEAARIYDDLSRDYSCLLYTGWKKTGTINDFQEGKYEVLVANIRCVSRGFNLQNASRMFFYSSTFSLEDRLQTAGRIYRPGQKERCVYTDYLNEGTVDIKVVGALRQKRQLLDYIRGKSLEAFVEEDDEVTQLEREVA